MKIVTLKNICSLLLLLLVCNTTAQVKTPKLVYSKQGKFYHAGTDEIGDLYVITPTKKLVKYDNKGKEIGAFSSIFIDSTVLLNTQNAYKTLLFTRNDGILQVLDNNLSVNSKVNIYEKGIMQPSLFGLYNNTNAIWLYDINQQVLSRYNASFEPEYASKNIALLENKTFAPVNIFQHEKFMALLDTTYGIMSFDTEGNYQKLYTVPNATDAFMYQLFMFLSVKDTIKAFDLRNALISDAYSFPGAISIRFGYPFAAVLYPDRADLYQLFY